MMERKAYMAFGETGFGEMEFGEMGFGETGFGETGFGETGIHPWTLETECFELTDLAFCVQYHTGHSFSTTATGE